MIIFEASQKEQNIIRISHRSSAFSQAETIIEKTVPIVKMGKYDIIIPAGTFLQPSSQGQTALSKLVLKYLRDIKGNIADLSSFMEQYYISEEFSTEDLELYKENINMKFLNELLNGTLEHIETIDNILNTNLTGKYTFNIIDNLIKIILRLATYEFKYTDTDKKVIINEYVDISAEYFDTKVVSFVNATLDNLSKNIN